MIRVWRRRCTFEATALACAALLFCAGGRPAQAAQKRAGTALLVLPYVALSGTADAFAARVSAQVAAELASRAELRLVEAPDRVGNVPAEKLRAEAALASAQGRAMLEQAQALSGNGPRDQAVRALEKAIAALSSRPLAVDEATGKLLSDAWLSLAVERERSGDDDGGEAALDQLVRLDPDRELRAADYPPAFVHAFGAVQRSAFAEQRATIRVYAPAGADALDPSGDAQPASFEARVLLDGRPLHTAPVLLENVLPGAHVVRVERGGAAWAERVICVSGTEVSLHPKLGGDDAGPLAELRAKLSSGELTQASAQAAARLARAAFAQAALIGAIAREGDGYAVRSFLVLSRSEKVIPLGPATLDPQLVGSSLEVLRVADDVVAHLSAPGAAASLPIALGAASGPALPFPTASAAPPVSGLISSAAPASAAPASAAPVSTPPVSTPPVSTPLPSGDDGRRVAIPGAPSAHPSTVPTARAAAAGADTALAEAPRPAGAVAAPEPSRGLVIPRQATRDDDDMTAPAAKPRTAPPAAVKMQAVEANELTSVREPPPNHGHTALWIAAGVLVVGGLATGGYFLYENGRSPTSATVTAGWTHR